MKTRLRRALELRIGDRVVLAGLIDQRVTSTRLQGAGGGTVSVGFEGQHSRTTYRPGEWVTVHAATSHAPRPVNP